MGVDRAVGREYYYCLVTLLFSNNMVGEVGGVDVVDVGALAALLGSLQLHASSASSVQ